MLNLETRELMRGNAYNLVEMFLEEQIPFRIALWNNNDWSSPLPNSILESFPEQILLEISEYSLENSGVDEITGEIIIVSIFDSIEYYKILSPDEIIAVLDLDGQPFILNNFPQEEESFQTVDDATELSLPKTKEHLIDLITSEGVSKEAANKSVSVFLENNPELFKK